MVKRHDQQKGRSSKTRGLVCARFGIGGSVCNVQPDCPKSPGKTVVRGQMVNFFLSSQYLEDAMERRRDAVGMLASFSYARSYENMPLC